MIIKIEKEIKEALNKYHLLWFYHNDIISLLLKLRINISYLDTFVSNRDSKTVILYVDSFGKVKLIPIFVSKPFCSDEIPYTIIKKISWIN